MIIGAQTTVKISANTEYKLPVNLILRDGSSFYANNGNSEDLVDIYLSKATIEGKLYAANVVMTVGSQVTIDGAESGICANDIVLKQHSRVSMINNANLGKCSQSSTHIDTGGNVILKSFSTLSIATESANLAVIVGGSFKFHDGARYVSNNINLHTNTYFYTSFLI